ncbi:MAG: hypothetical protein J4400_02315 [Candidatus Aenigmarchaeota archaeon]|nr:hypothetical protein [Candidatus Aenigmarchaeota archaeon]
MSSKKRARKGIDSLNRRKEEHFAKIRKAQNGGKIELARYHEKEIENFEKAIEKRKRKMMPRQKRKK